MSLLSSLAGFVAWLSSITGIPQIILYAIPAVSFLATFFEDDEEIDIQVYNGRLRLTEADQKKISRMLNRKDDKQ